MKTKSSNVVLPFFLPDQYELLLKTINDLEDMEKTWQEWYKNHLIFKNQLLKQDINCVEIVVDVNELNDYCKLNNLENIKVTRDMYVLKLSCQ